MNDLEKKRILELKEAGYGYGSIAKELGLSKSTISSFIKSLDGYSICRRIQSKGKPIISNYEVECLCCHKKFYSYRSLKRKFCSRECFDVFRKGGVDNESK